jgi:hypothetical protein
MNNSVLNPGRANVLLVCVFLLIASFGCQAQTKKAQSPSAPSVVKIRQADQRFELTVNGQPYFIKGAGGGSYMDQLVKAGGNSIRTWFSSKDLLDQAQDKGLTVCMGLSLRLPRQGADYTDADFLTRQRGRIRDQVVQFKNHPALLMWGVGNEVEHQTVPEVAELVWKEIEAIAQMIKEIDPNHPVITVVAGGGRKLADIQRLCPSLDAIGINIYGKLAQIPEDIRRNGWQKPYIITEFGPRGWWEVQKTAWGMPIEDTSTEKSSFYRQSYLAGIGDKPNCLGSYVFLWGNKQEKTHTWFNLFLEDGTPTEMVDTMTFLWTGKWPQNRTPTIGDNKIYVEGNNQSHIFKASDTVEFKVDAKDPEGDAMKVQWDIRKDGADNPNTGGDKEERIQPIKEAVVVSESGRAQIRMPQEPGNYRIFVYVSDPSAQTATANLPIQVK